MMKMEKHVESDLCRIPQLETKGQKYSPGFPGDTLHAYKSQI